MSLENKVRYQKRRRAEAEDACASILPEKMGLRVEAIWFVRAGLSKPTIPPRTLRDFIREFPEQETAHISETSISRGRDAFCQLIKRFNRAAVSTAAPLLAPGMADVGSSHLMSEPVVILQIHDEV